MNEVTSRSRRVAALVCLLGSLWAGCASSEPKGEWVQGKVSPVSDRVLREVTALAMQKSGFPGGSGIEPGKLEAMSGWHISLAPFRGKGFREQCEVKYTPISAGEYQVDVRVRREKNDDIVKPLDITYADWKPEPDNPERAKIVLQYISSMLGSKFEVGAKRSPQSQAQSAPPKDSK